MNRFPDRTLNGKIAVWEGVGPNQQPGEYMVFPPGDGHVFKAPDLGAIVTFAADETRISVKTYGSVGNVDGDYILSGEGQTLKIEPGTTYSVETSKILGEAAVIIEEGIG